MYSDNRDDYRHTFFTTWQKYLKKLPLQPIEIQLIEIIRNHPEYHPLLAKNPIDNKEEFALEENPFFHMSLHLALNEQIHTNRPIGITILHQELLAKYGDAHEVAHRMMTCLAEIMWQAQQTGVMAKEEDYLEKLKANIHP